MNLVRDKETGKSKGFAFLKYEDQRSTDLAVDNLGGATVLGRVLKVDHTRYKKKDEEVGDNTEVGDRRVAAKPGNGSMEGGEESEEEKRPLLKEERELAELIRDHDEDDPMKEYLIQEKKEEIREALARLNMREGKSREGKRRHHHRHRSRRDEEAGDRKDTRERRHRHHAER